MSRTMCENIFTQAAFAPSVWDLAWKVIEMYENGKLKNQKLSKKCMIEMPEFKQHNFQCLHNLPPVFQQEVLQEVIDGTSSLDEMKKKANKFRSFECIKKAFTKYTNSTWDEAVERFPWHTDEERLATFLGLDFVKKVPESFKAYCQAAMQDERQQVDMLSHDGAVGSVHTLNVMELSINAFIESCPTYTGAHLILTSVPKVAMHYYKYICKSYVHTVVGCVAIINIYYNTNQSQPKCTLYVYTYGENACITHKIYNLHVWLCVCVQPKCATADH